MRLIIPGENGQGYEVSTLAGQSGIEGMRDGPGGQALFNAPHAVASEADDGLLVVDIGKACLRRTRAITLPHDAD